jgi:hypothetical protein
MKKAELKVYPHHKPFLNITHTILTKDDKSITFWLSILLFCISLFLCFHKAQFMDLTIAGAWIMKIFENKHCQSNVFKILILLAAALMFELFWFLFYTPVIYPLFSLNIINSTG